MVRATVYLYVDWCTGKSTVSLYTVYAAATTAGLSEFCRNKRRAPRQAAVRANHKRSRLEGRASEQSEGRRSVMACRGAARERGRQGVDRLVVCFRAEAQNNFWRNHKRNKPAESPLVPGSSLRCRRSPSVLHAVGEATFCAAPDIFHAHTSTLRETLVELTIEVTG